MTAEVEEPSHVDAPSAIGWQVRLAATCLLLWVLFLVWLAFFQ